MTVFTEARHAGEAILSEANGHRSREGVILGGKVAACSLLALLATVGAVSATAAAAAGNTGNGAITVASPAVTAKAKNGEYSLIFTGATTFDVEDPDGKKIGSGTSGTAFSKEIKFTLAAGSTANVAGDRYTITVAVETGDLEAVPFNPAGTDGSEKPTAMAIHPGESGEKIAAIVRDAELNVNCIEWPAGITADQKAAAITNLRIAGIIAR